MQKHDDVPAKDPIGTRAAAGDDSSVGSERPQPAPLRTCLVVDDHPAMRSSLGSLLRHEGFVVVGEAATGAEATRVLQLHRPDVAVIDFRLPDLTGLDIARAAARVSPATALVVHTSDLCPNLLQEALAAGVRGIVVKAVPPTRLLTAISAALAGDVYLDPDLPAPAPVLTRSTGRNWGQVLRSRLTRQHKT